MFIEIEDLKDEPLHVQHLYGVDELSFEHKDAVLDEPVDLEFTLNHKDRDLQIGGVLRTAVRYTCSRCLREFSRKLSTSFDLLYLPQPKWAGENEEIELKYDEMDIGFYDGIRLDIDLMTLEQIELSMPMKFVCQENCRGLCPNCGAYLNDETCLCKQDTGDSRMAVLLDFRKKMGQ